MTVSQPATQGTLVRRARIAQAITAEQAGIRWGRDRTTVEALEADELEVPTDQLSELLMVLGEKLLVGSAGELTTSPLTGIHDPAQVAEMVAQAPDWRLAHALDWNEFAAELYLAGRAGVRT